MISPFTASMVSLGIGIRNACPTYANPWKAFGVILVVARVELLWLVELELIEDGVSVEFMDTSEKNTLRTVSAFDIGEEASLLHESGRFVQLQLCSILTAAHG